MAYRSDKPKKRLSKAKQFQLALDQWNAYTRARDNGHQDYIAVAKRCDAFYRGEQWDAADLSTLDDQGRPALTINTILPTINLPRCLAGTIRNYTFFFLCRFARSRFFRL